MAGPQAKPPMKIERKIGSTTYIVTSQFRDEGSTAKDKVQRLINLNTKADSLLRKV